jgi:hypothetical protein
MTVGVTGEFEVEVIDVSTGSLLKLAECLQPLAVETLADREAAAGVAATRDLSERIVASIKGVFSAESTRGYHAPRVCPQYVFQVTADVSCVAVARPLPPRSSYSLAVGLVESGGKRIYMSSDCNFSRVYVHRNKN